MTEIEQETEKGVFLVHKSGSDLEELSREEQANLIAEVELLSIDDRIERHIISEAPFLALTSEMKRVSEMIERVSWTEDSGPLAGTDLIDATTGQLSLGILETAETLAAPGVSLPNARRVETKKQRKRRLKKKRNAKKARKRNRR